MTQVMYRCSWFWGSVTLGPFVRGVRPELIHFGTFLKTRDSRGTEERRGFIWNILQESRFLLTDACGVFIFIGMEIMLSNCHCLQEKCCICLKVCVLSKLPVSQTWHVTAEIIWDAPVKGTEDQIPRGCGPFLYINLSEHKGVFQKHTNSVLSALIELILHSLDPPQ